MGMSSYSIQTLTEKLDRLSLSQDSIETLSLWMIHHKSKANTSVSTWLEEFKKGEDDVCQDGHVKIYCPLSLQEIQKGGSFCSTSLTMSSRIAGEEVLKSSSLCSKTPSVRPFPSSGVYVWVGW